MAETAVPQSLLLEMWWKKYMHVWIQSIPWQHWNLQIRSADVLWSFSPEGAGSMGYPQIFWQQWWRRLPAWNTVNFLRKSFLCLWEWKIQISMFQVRSWTDWPWLMSRLPVKWKNSVTTVWESVFPWTYRLLMKPEGQGLFPPLRIIPDLRLCW